MPAFLAAAKVDSYEALLALPDAELVPLVWKSSAPLAMPSNHPKNFVYTSGSSGYKAKGLVQDVGGYTTGAANTMTACFDATPGEDVIFTDAQPSWVTGRTCLCPAPPPRPACTAPPSAALITHWAFVQQWMSSRDRSAHYCNAPLASSWGNSRVAETYGITGPLATRVTSVLVTGMGTSMAQNLATVVKELKVTIFVASAAFLKRALKNTWQAAWLQRQNLHQQVRLHAVRDTWP